MHALLKAASRRPPQWLAIEFFPDMLRAAGSDPADVLRLLAHYGFHCSGDPGEKAAAAIPAGSGIDAFVKSIRPSVHIDLTCRHRAGKTAAR